MQQRTKGMANAIISSASFGLIPLFAVPLMQKEVPSASMLIYRFLIGAAALLLLLTMKHISLRVRLGDLLRILSLSLLYTASALCLFCSYRYMSSGVATTLIFTYPIWTALFTAIQVRHLPGTVTLGAILTAFVGVAFLSGLTGGVITSVIGPLLAIFSGVCYALYMVVFPTMRIRSMGVLKLNFYIFLSTSLLLILYALSSGNSIYCVNDGSVWVLLLLLGIIPTAVSNLTLIRALNQTDSTTVAVLGAFEPLTAMVVGILLLNDPFTWRICLGFGLILLAVIVLIVRPEKTAQSSEENTDIDVASHLYPTRRHPSKRRFIDFLYKKKS